MSCTILLDFRARADTVLVDAPSLTLALRHGALLLTAPGVELDMEDTAPLADGISDGTALARQFQLADCVRH